ncbi:MAG: hypothetical protein ACRCVT_03670 [Leadbetterella sp.]
MKKTLFAIILTTIFSCSKSLDDITGGLTNQLGFGTGSVSYSVEGKTYTYSDASFLYITGSDGLTISNNDGENKKNNDEYNLYISLSNLKANTSFKALDQSTTNTDKMYYFWPQALQDKYKTSPTVIFKTNNSSTLTIKVVSYDQKTIKGTFSGTLVDNLGNKGSLNITNGTFEGPCTL